MRQVFTASIRASCGQGALGRHRDARPHALSEPRAQGTPAAGARDDHLVAVGDAARQRCFAGYTASSSFTSSQRTSAEEQARIMR